ncbi:MAG: hypothetical protein AAGA67_02245 [Cyanobacteria bacterium P01_F01_bin.153]
MPLVIISGNHLWQSPSEISDIHPTEGLLMAFSVSSTREGNYGAYALEDDTSSARAVVVPERGGIVTRWRVGVNPSSACHFT